MDSGEGDLEQALVAARSGMAVAHWASLSPDRTALSHGAQVLTFGELNARSNALVRVLRAAGLRPGDGLALLCSNRVEYAEVVIARERTGMRLIPLNWHLSAAEIAYIVRDSGARAMIAEARFAAVAALVADELDIKLSVDGAIAGFTEYEAALATQPTHDVETPVRGFDDDLHVGNGPGDPKASSVRRIRS